MSKEGYLLKESVSCRGFHKRFFKLVDGQLMYQKSRKDSTPIMQFGVKGCKVETESRKKEFEFGILIQGGGAPRKYHLAATSDKERDEWITVLKQVADSSSTPAPVEIPKAMYKFNSRPVELYDFTVLKIIGQGTFGKVVKVRLRPTGQEFAMKVMKKDKVKADNMVKNTLAEKNILQTLDHPYIVKLHFAFQTQSRLYLIMDLLSGGELFDEMSAVGPFDEDRCRLYGAEIASAIAHIHSHNIVYRDLKPENIVLDAQGHACLTDFGIAKVGVTARDRTNTFCGTPEYVAPEMLNKIGHSHGVDWWAFGILLFEMLCGNPPFYDEDPDEMYKLIRTGDVPFPDEMGADARDLLTGLLDKDEKKRFSDGKTVLGHPFFASIDMVKLMKRELTGYTKST